MLILTKYVQYSIQYVVQQHIGQPVFFTDAFHPLLSRFYTSISHLIIFGRDTTRYVFLQQAGLLTLFVKVV